MFEYKLAKCELDRYGLVEFKSNERAYKGVDIQPERTSDKYKRLSRYRSFAILEKWIVSGEWDEETVKSIFAHRTEKFRLKMNTILFSQTFGR